MNIQIQLIDILEKETLRSMLKAYLSELSVSAIYPYIDLYWEENSRFPYVLIMNETWIGFALINRVTINNLNSISIAEYYIKPEFRRLGFGLKFVKLILNQYPENWEIAYSSDNLNAKLFWSKVYHDLSQPNYTIDIIEK
jgi:predicted acetyltransferase